ncbi:NAD(P)-dependent oxidoreductase [Microvirga aerophila]|uniref:6-phosphogluconate dehydrogenase n=1 Tax=Microvirga aerophila TaxID=670291 RepID=A0A512BVZ2_9HYPH|nr:NAD(P)-dependent oxidoreductase [Microvirga aerophila]GEO16128.1 6-phosphogluconate dehydrogenase [Microvirga aerophila]
MKIAIIGFGEAGQSISRGLAPSASQVTAYDLRFQGADRAKLLQQAQDDGVLTQDRLVDAVAGADVILSTVVANVALKVGTDVADVLSPGQAFVDLNSVSPRTKQAISQKIANSGADFVEGAVMARVGADGHKTPILLAGPKATSLAGRLNGIGMNTEAVGETIGQASASKMLRSIMAKGISALLLECLIAAHRYNIVDRILDSIGTSFPGIDWDKTSTYYLGRIALHGTRMGAEMKEVADTLSDVDIDPILALAIGERIAWGGKHLAGIDWPDDKPGDREEILAALERRLRAH